MQTAAKEGNLNVVAFLIEKCANLEEKESVWEKTPLHLTKDIEIAKLLIRSGAKSSEKDYSGKTAPILDTPEMQEFLKEIKEQQHKLEIEEAQGTADSDLQYSTDVLQEQHRLPGEIHPHQDDVEMT